MPRLEALTTGQLLDRIFALYRKHFVLFFAIAVIPQISRILVLLLPALAIGGGGAFATRIVGMIVGGIIWLAAFTALLAMSQGATTVAVSDIYLDQPTSVKACYSRVFPMTGRLIGMMFGYALLVGIGLIFLIVPGVYFAITYALATAVMAIENVSFSEAMTRSKDLVKGQRGRIVVIFLLSVAIQWAAQFALALPVELLATRLTLVSPLLTLGVNQLVEVVASALSTPIGLIGLTLAYYDARVRKEAFDLEYMMDLEAAAMPPMPVEAIAASASAGAGVSSSGTTASTVVSGSAGDVVAANTGGSTFMLFDQQNSAPEPATPTPAAPEPGTPTEG